MRVLVADDHALFRGAPVALLGQEPDIQVIGEAGDGKLAVTMARELHPDVVLMNARLPVLDSVEATRLICAKRPGVRVITLSIHHAKDAHPLLDAGAVAHVSKCGSPATLLKAIRRWAAG